jgi:hypothetical protein
MNKIAFVVAVVVMLAVFAVAPLHAEARSVGARSAGTVQATPVPTASHAAIPSPEPACFTQVSVSLSCSSSCIGDKTHYACTATGSGGYGEQWYVFSWSGANPYSGSGDNPNLAYRNLTPGGPCEDVVRVDLTDGCSSDSASRTVYDYCDSNCRLLP